MRSYQIIEHMSRAVPKVVLQPMKKSQAIALLCVLSLSCRAEVAPPPGSQPELDEQLMQAVGNDDLASTERLLSAGANPNALEAETHNQDTVLTKAVVHARPELIKRLLEAGSDPNSRQGLNRSGKTALMITVEADIAEVAALLLDAGAAVEARVGGISAERNIQGGTTDALAAAVESGHSETLRLLLLAGARIDRIHLELAVRSGRPELLRLLLRAGGDPRAVLRNGQSLLQAVNAAADPVRTEMVDDVRQFLHPQ